MSEQEPEFELSDEYGWVDPLAAEQSPPGSPRPVEPRADWDETAFASFDDTGWVEPVPAGAPARSGGRPPSLRPRERLAVLIGLVVLLVIVLAVSLSSCSGTGSADAARGYLTKLAGPAADSQRVGGELSSLLARPGGSLAAVTRKLGELVRRSEKALGSVQRLKAPPMLADVQQSALQALGFRVSGLQGMLGVLGRPAGAKPNQAAAAGQLAGQAARLIASDVIWQDLVQNAAASDLARRQVTGIAPPASRFLANADLSSIESLLGFLQRLTGTAPPTAVTLRLGDHGSAVAAWQRLLNRWLAATSPSQKQLTADGVFGASTQTTTQALQSAQGLVPDGVVGSRTRQALQAALSRSGVGSGTG